jgi:O-antigen/teichoic acid export membrane protein
MKAPIVGLRPRLLSFMDHVSLLPLVSALISRLSVYATLIVTAHLLDPEQFGTYAVCLVAIGILSALMTGGGDMWLNRFTGELASTSGQAPRLWLVYFVVVLAVSLTLIVLVMTIEVIGLLHGPLADFGLITALISALIGCTEAILATMRAGGSIRLFFVSRDIVIPLSYLVLLLGFKPETTRDALLVYLCLWGVAFLVVAFRLIWRAPTMLPATRPPRLAWFPALRHTFGLIYGNLTSRLAIYIDVLVLTTATSIVTIGEYRVAAQFAIGFMIIQHFVFLGLPWQMRSGRLGSDGAPGLAILLIATVGGAILFITATPLLSLLGDRFAIMTPVFQILLVTRFVSLLWGPQHEILISNGLAIKDAHANVTSIAAWGAAFTACRGTIDAVDAAVVATCFATLVLHLSRFWILRHHGLPQIYGHPLGAAGPTIGLLLVAGAAWWYARLQFQ